MGTHSILESDFDCLTEKSKMETPTKKLGSLCLEDKENCKPDVKPKDTSDEKKADKFPIPKMPPNDKNNGQRDPLSPKKGFKVNTSSMPAYMRATASSSVKKSNAKKNLTDKLTGSKMSEPKKTLFSSHRPTSGRPTSSRPTSSIPTSSRPVTSSRSTVSSTRPGSANVGATKIPTNKISKANMNRPTSATPGIKTPRSNISNRPSSSLIRPQSSKATGSVAKPLVPKPVTSSAKPKSDRPQVTSKWDRLATPKQKVTSVRRTGTEGNRNGRGNDTKQGRTLGPASKTTKPSTLQKTKPNAPKATSTPA